MERATDEAMSLDYPFYEELCRRKHPARWWWIVGDRLYYLGLLPAMVATMGIPFELLHRTLHHYRLIPIPWLLVVIGGGIPLFLLGAQLKEWAYQLVERDGVTAESVYHDLKQRTESQAETEIDREKKPKHP